VWQYCPSNFNECVEKVWCPTGGGKQLPPTSVPAEWPENTCTSPYDWNHGIVVKKFLVGEANIVNEFYVRYSAPEWYDVYPSNVRGNTVYTDGWYSGYYFNIFKWGANSVPGYTTGMIIWHNNDFWISLTGSGIEPGTSSSDWSKSISLENWLSFMGMLQGEDTDDLGFFLLNQFLVTEEINSAILNEVMISSGTYPLDYGTSCISDWMKLTQKKVGAVANFYNENFKDAQRIISQTRDLRTSPQIMGFSGIRAKDFPRMTGLPNLGFRHGIR